MEKGGTKKFGGKVKRKTQEMKRMGEGKIAKDEVEERDGRKETQKGEGREIGFAGRSRKGNTTKIRG